MKRQAMFMIDGEQRIKLRNTAAAALLARRDLVVEQGGFLSCRDAESARRVSSALRSMGLANDQGDAAPRHERRAIWLRGADGRHVAGILHALWDESRHERRRDRALLTVIEPGANPSVDIQVLCKTYGLTTAESRLAALIATGHSTARCARELDIKTSTLRTHLGAIYRKTGAHDKPDLVRLVLSLCAI